MSIYEINRMILNAKYFFVGVDENNGKYIDCFTQNIEGGQEGFKLKIEYLHGEGFSWEVYPFKMGNGIIEKIFDEGDKSRITKTPREAFNLFGNTCPKCKQKLFNEFNWTLHNPNTCGQKKAINVNDTTN